MTPRRALLIAATAFGQARGAAAQDGRPIDLMPDFWRAYDMARDAAEDARARAIIDGFFMPHRAVIGAAGIGRVDVARWLAQFDPMAEEVRRLSLGFAGTWATQAARFARVLPDFDATIRIAILVSFLNFDARVRLWGDRVALFVGLDGVVRFGASLPILFAHECFHLYHHQVNPTLILPGGDPLWLGVWKEGLAVHASAALNPDAGPVAVLLGEDALARADGALVRRLAAAAMPLLDETVGAARSRFLSYGGGGDLPSRGGYLLGLLVVRRVAAGRDLAALARVPAEEARGLVRREVAAMAMG